MELERLGNPWRTPEDRAFLPRTTAWLVGRLAWLFRAYGVDPAILSELLRVRMVQSMREGAKTGNAGAWLGIALGVAMSGSAGLMTGVLALLVDEPKVWVVVSLSLLVLLQAMMLLTHLSAILVDPTDVRVISPHPVPDRALLAARIVQLFTFTLLLSAGFAAGGMALAIFKHPPLGVLVVYPVLALLCTFVAVGGMALLFALLLRLFGPGRFQGLTLWAQILGGVLVLGAAQVGPHLERSWTPDSFAPEIHPALYLWPPFQYGAAFELALGAWSRGAALATAAAVITPALALAATLALASRYFAAGLEGSLAPPATSRSAWPSGTLRSLLARLPLSREQRAGFDYTLALTRREPHFLRVVLPQLASFQIMAIAMLFTRRGEDDFLSIPLAAGFLAMTLPGMLEFAQETPVPQARWVFLALPVEKESALLRGGVKALFLGWWGIAALVIATVQALLLGPGSLPRIVLAHELALCLGLVFTRRFELGVPFTRVQRVATTSGANMGKILLMGIALMPLVAVHSLLCLHPIALWCGVAAFFVAAVLAWRSLDSLQVARARRLSEDSDSPRSLLARRAGATLD